MLRTVLLLISLFRVTCGLITNHFSNEKSESKAVVDLTLVLSSCSSRECLDFGQPLVFINSSSQIHSILFTLDRCSFGRIEKDSFLWSNSILWSSDRKIEVMYKNRVSAFICSGEIMLRRMDIRSIYEMKSVIESERSGSDLYVLTNVSIANTIFDAYSY